MREESVTNIDLFTEQILDYLSTEQLHLHGTLMITNTHTHTSFIWPSHDICYISCNMQNTLKVNNVIQWVTHLLLKPV